MSFPRTGPCDPWTAADQIESLPAVTAAIQNTKLEPEQVTSVLAEAAIVASEILYELSGRIFTGECGPVTVRPISRPTDADTRSWGAALSPLGWFSSWGLCTSYGSSIPGVMSHYGCSNPPEIELGAYPVTEIVQVLIDGVVIPADEYELRNHRWLVRMRTSASSAPTERWGWPTCQINDLPDSQEGTFSVTYRYGSPPPASGKLAARKLAEYLALPQISETARLPQRTTQVSRQGVTAQAASVTDLIKDGLLGIYEVDVFLQSVNPSKNKRQATVWSPDIGRPRRTATPSLPS